MKEILPEWASEWTMEIVRITLISSIIAWYLGRKVIHGADGMSEKFIRAFQDSVRNDILPTIREHLSSASGAVEDAMGQITKNIRIATESKEIEFLETESRSVVEGKIAETVEQDAKVKLGKLIDQIKISADNRNYSKCEDDLRKFVEIATEDESVGLILEVVAIYMRHDEVKRALLLLERYGKQFKI